MSYLRREAGQRKHGGSFANRSPYQKRLYLILNYIDNLILLIISVNKKRYALTSLNLILFHTRFTYQREDNICRQEFFFPKQNLSTCIHILINLTNATLLSNKDSPRFKRNNTQHTTSKLIERSTWSPNNVSNHCAFYVPCKYTYFDFLP